MTEATPESGVQFPQFTPDRRRRHRGRGPGADRRVHERYVSDFPVFIYIGEGENERVYRAIARDVSNGGVRLENIDIPPTEERVRMFFTIPEGTMPEEFVDHYFDLQGKVRFRSQDNQHLGVEFTEPLHRRLAKSTWQYVRVAAGLVLFMAITVVLLLKVEGVYFFWFDVPSFLYTQMVGAYLITRFLFAAFYHPPVNPILLADLPNITVIVPAFNEEEHIAQTLISILEAEYPADKLQLIAINDGSTDRTFEEMKKVRDDYPEMVLVNLTESRGKRIALTTGTRMATGDILIFTDSDSFLRPNALRHLVEGFSDPEVGAICGHCDVANPWSNLLTRMQAVRYYISFRVMKAAESVFDSVTCLSGPLAAYRRDILMTVLDQWATQTFFGRPATFGDDRSLTNFILHRGYKVIYDSRAITATMVPEDYRTFLRQQARWKRSWLRETFRALSFMWRRPPLMSMSFVLGFILPILGPAIVFRALVYIPLFQRGTPFVYLFGILTMSMMMSSVYLLARRSRLWLYGVPFCFFYMLVLVWQLPWALLTCTTSAWGTRAPSTGPTEEAPPGGNAAAQDKGVEL